ncbi:hypothetical protein KHA96_15775 [Bacillus sp. FJAT-49711]|uniref:hypothetical protein n=1 Tax=Bacillus sp. FJAT-49711 TaxID=2833585 RepID=UPI001BC8F07F|nr:hypothetical protein [Bacillus sp. FJAT-49711]MBS4219773.1 hypothetical protein [Bacillus sp. FJAT-49711]
MKIIGILLLLIAALMFLSLSIDFFFLGFSLRSAIHDWFRPFSPIILVEKVILVFYPLLIFTFIILNKIINKRQS